MFFGSQFQLLFTDKTRDLGKWRRETEYTSENDLLPATISLILGQWLEFSCILNADAISRHVTNCGRQRFLSYIFEQQSRTLDRPTRKIGMRGRRRWDRMFAVFVKPSDKVWQCMRSSVYSLSCSTVIIGWTADSQRHWFIGLSDAVARLTDS